MPDYRESTAPATTWRRAHRVEIYNPMPGQGVPFVEFREEDAIKVGERIITTPAPNASSLLKRFDPVAGAFPLRDPKTGALTGATMTHGELYAILHSLYIHEALERDARDAAAAAAPATPQQPS